MNAVKKLSGIALAAAAAGMFMSVSVGNAVAGDKAADKGKTQCEGVNACKGTGSCKSAHNACKGQNACKGKGVMEMSAADCKAAQDKAKKS